MDWRPWGVAIVLLLTIGGVFFAVGGAAADSSQFETEKSGVTVQMPSGTESDILDEAEDLAESVGFGDVPTNAAYLQSGDERIVVVSDQEISTGEATVQGYETSLSDGTSVFVATDVSVSTEGDPVSYDEVMNNPDEYNGELVRFTIDYGQIAIATEAGQGVVQGQSSMGSETAGIDLLPPGETGVFAANLTTEGGVLDESKITDRLGSSPDLPLVSLTDQSYWIDEEVTLDVAIISDGPVKGAHIADRSFDSQTVDGINEIQSGEYDGELVTIQGDAVESKISTSETLQQALPCGTDLINIGVACVPAVTDAVAHAGVMYEETDGEGADMLTFSAISNAQQNQPVTGQDRNVRITGEVVSTSSISPDLPEGRSIVAYDIEYINHNQNDAPVEVSVVSDSYDSFIEDQIVSSAEQSSGSEPSGGGSTDGGSDSEGEEGSGGSDETDGGSSGGDQQNTDETTAGSENNQQTSSTSNSGSSTIPMIALLETSLIALLGMITVVALGGVFVQEGFRYWKDESRAEELRRLYLSTWLLGGAAIFGFLTLMAVNMFTLLFAIPAAVLTGLSITGIGLLWEYNDKGQSKYNQYTSLLGIGLLFLAVFSLLIWRPSSDEILLLSYAFFFGIVVVILGTILWVLAEGLEYLIGWKGSPAEGESSFRYSVAKVGSGALIGLLVIVSLLFSFIDPLYSIIGILLTILLLAAGAVVRMAD